MFFRPNIMPILLFITTERSVPRQYVHASSIRGTQHSFCASPFAWTWPLSQCPAISTATHSAKLIPTTTTPQTCDNTHRHLPSEPPHGRYSLEITGAIISVSRKQSLSSTTERDDAPFPVHQSSGAHIATPTDHIITHYTHHLKTQFTVRCLLIIHS